MGNTYSNCFTCKPKASDRWNREEEEENKHHHEQQNKTSSNLPDQSTNAPADENRIGGDLSDRGSEGEENKHHERQNSTGSSDRISDLPDDMLHLILSFLPFKSVGQTSVLSRRWSHVWSSYPILDLYEIFTGNEVEHHQTRVWIINTVFARNDENYNISCHKIPLPRDNRLGQLRREPNRARVDELVLDVSMRSANRYAKPLCQLKCQSIRSSSCGSSKAWLGFPSTYVVWSYLLSLQDLSLEFVDFSDSASGMDLFSVSSFPFLKKLKISYCKGMTALKICCPNLHSMGIYGMHLHSMNISGIRLETICASNCIDGCVNIVAPNLQTLLWGDHITEKSSIHAFPTPKKLCMRNWNSAVLGDTTTKKSVGRVMSFSSQLEILEIDCHYLGILSEIYLESGGLPFSFQKLETLSFWHVSRLRYIPGIACILKSSPVVHTLNIWIHSFEENDKWNNILLDNANCTQKQYWKTQAQYLIPFLSHLKVVVVGFGYTISENALTFAKFLLKYGRGLQKMTLSVSRRSSKNSLPPKSLSVAIALLKASPRASAAVEFSTL